MYHRENFGIESYVCANPGKFCAIFGKMCVSNPQVLHNPGKFLKMIWQVQAQVQRGLHVPAAGNAANAAEAVETRTVPQKMTLL